MKQYLIIGNGEVKDSLTLEKRTITDHIHSMYDDEKTALHMVQWLNQIQTGLKYHVEERTYAFPA